jgi:hypothetical protein
MIEPLETLSVRHLHRIELRRTFAGRGAYESASAWAGQKAEAGYRIRLRARARGRLLRWVVLAILS